MFKWEFINAAYQKWKQGRDITPDGTPLGVWPAVGPEQAEALRRKDIHTVEQVAQLTDTHIMQFGIQGLRALRDQATRYINNMGAHQLEAQLAEKDQQINGLTDQVAELARLVREMQQASQATLAPRDGGHSEQVVNEDDAGNDDAFGEPVERSADDVQVTTAPRRARR